MRQIIETKSENCKGCAECIRVCPVKEANIVYYDADKLKVHTDPNQCIACGACLTACPFGVRFYNDDTEQFFNDLRSGDPIALIVAPTFIENFENWRSILTWLQELGTTAIVDVSLGIDICTWAHIRYIEQYHPSALITQPCPAIAGYIEKHCPQIVANVSPVQSPILCTSIYLKNTLALPEKIAALTPCPAKSNEFAEANIVSYNVTFKKLAEYITAHDISIPQAGFEFDNIAVAPGRASTTPSSLAESVKRSTGCISFIGSRRDINTTRSRGYVYRYLDLISNEVPKNCPVLLDALNCIGGCSFGAGCNLDKPELHPMAHKHYEVEAERAGEQAKLFSVFDNMLKLSDFIKGHPDKYMK